MSQQTGRHDEMFGGNLKELVYPLVANTTTTVLTGACIKQLKHGIRIKRAFVRAHVVGGGAVACTVVLGYGAAVGTIDTIFGTATIADVSAVSIADVVAVTPVDSGSNGVPDNQDVPGTKYLLCSTTKASTVTFLAGELVVEYVDRDTNA